MNTGQSYTANTEVASTDTDHDEIMRRTWILYMLSKRRGWFDEQTINSRAVELESHLKRHLDNEQAEIRFLNRGTAEAASDTEHGREVLLHLARRMRELRPLDEKWDDTFQIFEAELRQHVHRKDGQRMPNRGKKWQTEGKEAEIEERLLAV